MSQSLRIQLVTPAPARSLHGNRVSAVRWARLLREFGHRVDVVNQWEGSPCDVLIALHARRSAKSVARFAERFPGKPLIVVLTGTDLYRDLPGSLPARKSLELATRLVILQADGMRYLSVGHRRKTRVIIQSARKPKRRIPALKRVMEVAVFSHLRTVKDPLRAALASRRLPACSRRSRGTRGFTEPTISLAGGVASLASWAATATQPVAGGQFSPGRGTQRGFRGAGGRCAHVVLAYFGYAGLAG